MMTAMLDAVVIAKSKVAGADGYLTKPVAPGQYVATLRFLANGLTCECLLLSHRDNEVMRLLAEGLLYKEIADRLRISYSAVHKHQRSIFLKLRVSNRAEAIGKWRDAGGS
jgi:DNA-binding NarL/FixJ family response regulator